MRIRILVQRFGLGAKWNKGNVLTVGHNISQADAERLLDAGEAEEDVPAGVTLERDPTGATSYRAEGVDALPLIARRVSRSYR